MKYRRLSNTELQELEGEFITFLSANTVTASDWEKLKAEKPEKANDLIDLFSDIVYDKILNKVNLLEVRTKSDLRFYEYFDDKVTMLGLRIEGTDRVDFTANEDPSEMMAKMKLYGGKLQMYKGQRAYQKDKNLEIFDALEKEAALIVKDDTLYQSIKGMA